MNLGLLKYFIVLGFIFNFSNVYSEPIEGYEAKIQILDKITSKVSKIKIEVNKTGYFESLEIKIYSCFKNPPEEIPEDYVLLVINDNLNLDDNKVIYQGWMISSSPAVTPLEHPIYDLRLISCKIKTDF